MKVVYFAWEPHLSEADDPDSLGKAYSNNQLLYRKHGGYHSSTLQSLCLENSDVLVVSRIVRFDADGSAIVVWKLLKSYPVPHIQ